MAAVWTDADVFKLIELWGEEGIQEQLEGSKRNKHVYEKLSNILAKHKIEKTGEQCRCKLKKLCQEYKKIKDTHNKTGTGRKKWRFYDSLNEVLGNRPVTCPPVVIDMSDETTLMLSEERAGEDSDHEDDPTVYERGSENVEDDGAGTSTVVESSDRESSTIVDYPRL